VLHAGSDLDFALAGWVLDAEQQQSELHEWNGLEQQCLVSSRAIKAVPVGMAGMQRWRTNICMTDQACVPGASHALTVAAAWQWMNNRPRMEQTINTQTKQYSTVLHVPCEML